MLVMQEAICTENFLERETVTQGLPLELALLIGLQM